MTTGVSLFGEPSASKGKRTYITYDLTLVERGEKAVQTVEKAVETHQPFAAAFIDMNMPGIDGAETAKRIWDIDPKVKIIVVTAYSEYTPDDIIRVTGRDDIFYLRKPFNSEEIGQFARVLINEWNLEQERMHLSDQLEKANKELSRINKYLQNKVQEQTAMLVQSEKMASLGILAAGVAHEINNPVSFVNTNLASLQKYCGKISNLLHKYKDMETHIRCGNKDNLPADLDKIDTFKEKHHIGFILEDIVNLAEESLEGTQRISGIVRDLKTFSHVDEAELKYINLKDSIDATLNILHNEMKNKVKIRIDYGELPEIRCFSQKISQVFMNILMNAIHAIENEGTIELVTRHVKEGRRVSDEFVEIRISDSGCGIPKAHLSKIFDPFFTTKPVGEGTGLGLSITYDIVKAHGGHIQVESEEGSGTTFTIRLQVSMPPAVSRHNLKFIPPL